MTVIDSEEAIRQQLARISSSATFQQVDRLKRFLEFVVLETVAGRGNQLKEYVLGIQVFDKEDSFDPRTDPVVRVQARRLRTRLTKYYQEEGAHDSIVIEMPKGGYTPVFKKPDPLPARHSVAHVLASRNTITVAPFLDQSPAGDLGYFCGGLTQEIVHSLISCESVRVLVWADRPGQDAGQIDLREAANRLDAAMLVSGSVRLVGAVIRVSAQIIDGSSGAYVWSEAVDGTLEDVLGLQGRVASGILRRLFEAFKDGSSEKTIFPRPVENLAARNLYLQGRYHINQWSEEGLQKAVEFFEKALTEDSQYPLAFSGLADAYGLLGHYGVLAPAQVWTKTASCARSREFDHRPRSGHDSLLPARLRRSARSDRSHGRTESVFHFRILGARTDPGAPGRNRRSHRRVPAGHAVSAGKPANERRTRQAACALRKEKAGRSNPAGTARSRREALRVSV